MIKAGIKGKKANQDNGETTQNQVNQASAISKSNSLTLRLKRIKSPIAAKGKPKPNKPINTINGGTNSNSLSLITEK